MKLFVFIILSLTFVTNTFGQIQDTAVADSIDLPVIITDTSKVVIYSDSTDTNAIDSTTLIKVGMDSVWVNGRSILILGDSSIYIENDTVLLLPDSLATKLQRDRTSRSEEFYSKLKEKFHKKRFTRELYNLIFSDVGGGTSQPAKPSGKLNQKYDAYEGLNIDRVYIKNLNVLGTNINDTAVQVDMWAINLANNIHISTRKTVIRNNLFFQEGDAVDPNKLYDSERILRNLPYIKDARVYVIQKALDTTSVDVLVIVRDIWSITGSLNSVNISSPQVAITDARGNITEKNFLGLGHEFNNTLEYGDERNPQWGYRGRYIINNISRSFITAEFSYANTEPFSRSGFRLYRGFITPEIEYAGGLEMATEKILLVKDSSFTSFLEYNLQDLWLGRSFQLRNDHLGRKNLQIAARSSRKRFIDRPIVTEDTNQLFFQSNLYLVSVGLARRRYERSKLITGYGRTEDIPMGYLFEATLGWEENDFYTRPYVGARVSWGRYVRHMGYFRPEIDIGGFIRSNGVEQGIFKPQLIYFSNLYRIRKLNLRHFVRAAYTMGIGRFDQESIDIENRNGIRGLSSNLLQGTERISLKYEAVIFTPSYYLGFRLSIFTFADLGIVNSVNQNILRNNIYQGYGVGFRLRNENLVFKTIQLRFAFYPVVPSGSSNFGFDLSDQDILNLPDFRVEQPSVLGFR